MRILFVVDGRSPISQNWIRYFVEKERDHEVYLASTFDCELDFPVARLTVTPVAFSGTRRASTRRSGGTSRMLRLGSAQALGLRTRLRQWLGPWTIPFAAGRLRSFVEEVKPDLVHAMRIPYEGMLTAAALKNMDVPFLVSVWGNDFTLHAPSSPFMRSYTRRTMSRIDALHADCARDVRLAREWGLSDETSTFVAPGNGGVRTDIFYEPRELAAEPVIINPRGFRAYVRNDSFFRAIPLVLKKRLDARFICSSMEGEGQAMDWIEKLGIQEAVQLDAPMPHSQMAERFRSAQIVLSPSIHDGTPNSLLEGMACGCFPIAGDLESIREWITHAQNGLLVDPADPQAIADAVLLALEREDLRREAAGLNAKLVATRGEYGRNMKRAVEFYNALIAR